MLLFLTRIILFECVSNAAVLSTVQARLTQGILLKKIVEAIRDLVSEGNLDCNEQGISLQAMDSSHVSLCALSLRADGFDHYVSTCD